MLEVTQQVELVLEPEAPDAQTQHHTWHTVSLNLSRAAPKPQLLSLSSPTFTTAH